MTNILDKILTTKRQEVKTRSASVSLPAIKEKARQMPETNAFTAALKSKADLGLPAVIAEIKRASPSKGLIRENFDPEQIAKSYLAGGADCLSVLTDESYFKGRDTYVSLAKAASGLPILRKEFIIDEYQIYESRVLGADCILFIAAALNIMQLTVFIDTARGLNLDVLIEVHNSQELAAALSLNPAMIGINNRDLTNFETDINTSIQLIEQVPEHVLVVTESGIHTKAQVAKLRSAGVGAFLVGESFMRAKDPGRALQDLFPT